MKSLRKKPTFNELIYDSNHQPKIKYPERKGINILDDMVISNWLFGSNITKEEWEEIMISDKATQTPHEKGIQTDIFEKEKEKEAEIHQAILFKQSCMEGFKKDVEKREVRNGICLYFFLFVFFFIYMFVFVSVRSAFDCFTERKGKAAKAQVRPRRPNQGKSEGKRQRRDAHEWGWEAVEQEIYWESCQSLELARIISFGIMFSNLF